jgi:hypothetical protein
MKCKICDKDIGDDYVFISNHYYSKHHCDIPKNECEGCKRLKASIVDLQRVVESQQVTMRQIDRLKAELAEAVEIISRNEKTKLAWVARHEANK